MGLAVLGLVVARLAARVGPQFVRVGGRCGMNTDPESSLKSAVRGRSIEERLWNADDTLRAAVHGLELLQPHEVSIDDPDALPKMLMGDSLGLSQEEKFEIARRLHMGLRIATTFGVATTLALQSLRGHAEGFGEWWKPRSSALRSDPLARYLWDMRVEVAHNGTTGYYHVMTQATIAVEQAQRSVWLAFPNRFDGEDRAHVLIEKYLSELGIIMSDAWTQFSPATRSTGPR